MKQQDIAIVIVIVFIGGILSFFVSSKFIAPSDEKRTVKEVSAINSTFTLPDSRIFNENAINPTVKIEIKPGDNNQPFADEQ